MYIKIFNSSPFTTSTEMIDIHIEFLPTSEPSVGPTQRTGHLYIRGEGRREKNMNPREKTNQLIILHVGICNMSMLTGILVQSPSVQSDGAAGMARGSCIIV